MNILEIARRRARLAFIGLAALAVAAISGPWFPATAGITSRPALHGGLAIKLPGSLLVPPSPAPSDNFHDEGYFKDTALWFRFPVPVCWDMSSSSYKNTATQRDVVKKAMANSWSAVSNASFSGWGRCEGNPPSDGFSIAVKDVNPVSYGLGTEVKGEKDAIVFNFTYNNFSPGFCQPQISYCTRLIAVHEFGHALGLAHEQNRPDTPRTPSPDGKPIFICTQDAQGENGDVTVGAWDLHSVMNYCNPEWNGDGNLSATDIKTIVQMYGSAAKPLRTAAYTWKSLVYSSNCAATNSTLTLRSNGTAEWSGTMGPNILPFAEHLDLKVDLDKASGGNLQTMHFKSPTMNRGFTKWHGDARFKAKHFDDIKGTYAWLTCS